MLIAGMVVIGLVYAIAGALMAASGIATLKLVLARRKTSPIVRFTACVAVGLLLFVFWWFPLVYEWAVGQRRS